MFVTPGEEMPYLIVFEIYRSVFDVTDLKLIKFAQNYFPNSSTLKVPETLFGRCAASVFFSNVAVGRKI